MYIIYDKACIAVYVPLIFIIHTYEVRQQVGRSADKQCWD